MADIPKFIASMASGWRKDHSEDDPQIRITIGITTFEDRFEKYFVPLLTKIRAYDQETEVIVAVNTGSIARISGSASGPISFGSSRTSRRSFPFFFPGSGVFPNYGTRSSFMPPMITSWCSTTIS